MYVLVLASAAPMFQQAWAADDMIFYWVYNVTISFSS